MPTVSRRAAVIWAIDSEFWSSSWSCRRFLLNLSFLAVAIHKAFSTSACSTTWTLSDPTTATFVAPKSITPNVRRHQSEKRSNTWTCPTSCRTIIHARQPSLAVDSTGWSRCCCSSINTFVSPKWISRENLNCRKIKKEWTGKVDKKYLFEFSSVFHFARISLFFSVHNSSSSFFFVYIFMLLITQFIDYSFSIVKNIQK